MKYELLFLDVDGTLKQEPHPISQANKDAILEAMKAGKKVSITSGRNRDMILRTVEELQLNKFGEAYTIALNGAHIVENKTGRTLHTEPIPVDLTRYLFELANEHEVSCHVYTENYVYFNYNDFQFEWYQNEGCDCYLVDLSREDMGLKEEPLKFFFFNKEFSKLETIRSIGEPVASSSCSVEYSSRYSLEFTSLKASKGLALEYVCGLFNLPISLSVAAGDGENDISMIKKAGLGIAMKNALDSVKAIADTVTQRTCKEDGVVEIIQEYLL